MHHVGPAFYERSAILELKKELYGLEEIPVSSGNRILPRAASQIPSQTPGGTGQNLQIQHPRVSIPARPPTPPPKPKTITEIPQYLLKISSTLFKKATAAEIFLSRLENKKRVLNSRKKDQELRGRGMVKVSGDSQTRGPRENLVQNLMSEPSANLANRSQRRKSIEVLMTENISNVPANKADLQVDEVGGPLGANVSFNHQVGEMIASNAAIMDLNKSISKKSELQSPAEPIEREIGMGRGQLRTKGSHKRKNGDRDKVIFS